MKASRALNLNASLRAETRTRAEEGGLRVLQRLDVPPGRYQIRVAANQPGSATGSVVHDIDVPDFGVTLGISSVLLTSARPRRQRRWFPTRTFGPLCRPRRAHPHVRRG